MRWSLCLANVSTHCSDVGVACCTRLGAVTGYRHCLYIDTVVDVIGETLVKDVDRGCRAVDVVTVDVVYLWMLFTVDVKGSR